MAPRFYVIGYLSRVVRARFGFDLEEKKFRQSGLRPFNLR